MQLIDRLSVDFEQIGIKDRMIPHGCCCTLKRHDGCVVKDQEVASSDIAVAIDEFTFDGEQHAVTIAAVNQAGNREQDKYGESNHALGRLLYVLHQSCNLEFMSKCEFRLTNRLISRMKFHPGILDEMS